MERNFSLDTHDLREVITKKTLVQLNAKAIQRGYNKSLKPDMLDALPDTFAPTGAEIRFSFKIDFANDSHLAPDCCRLQLWLPRDPGQLDQNGVPDSMVPAWLDVKKCELKTLTIWVPKTLEVVK